MTRVGPFPWRSGLLLLAGLGIGAIGILARNARIAALVLFGIGAVVALAGIIGIWRGARWGSAAVLSLLGFLLLGSCATEAWLVWEASRGSPDLAGSIVGCGFFILIFGVALVMAIWAYQGRAPKD